VYLILTAVKRF